MRALAVSALLSLTLLACGSKKDPPSPGSAEPPKGSATEPPKGSAAEPAGSGSGSSAAAPKWEFDKLSHDEKIDFMKKTVVPTMKPVFQKFDAKEYAAFGCKTCHGKDPKATKYKMPTADLPPLDFAALEAGKQKPKVAKWMAEVVKPEMAKLLQLPEMTETEPKGFGCLGCHEMKKAK